MCPAASHYRHYIDSFGPSEAPSEPKHIEITVFQNDFVFGKQTAFTIAMIRAATFLTIFFVASPAWAQTPAEELARVLRDKQIITSTDYDRIMHASPGDEV